MALPVTIPELPAASTLTGTEQIELAQAGASVQTTLNSVLAGKVATPVTATSNTTVSNFNLVIADTTASAFTVTLPAAPVFGFQVWFVDPTGSWGTNNLTVAGNGSNIFNSSANLAATIARENFSLVYYNTAQGWILGE